MLEGLDWKQVTKLVWLSSTNIVWLCHCLPLPRRVYITGHLDLISLSPLMYYYTFWCKQHWPSFTTRHISTTHPMTWVLPLHASIPSRPCPRRSISHKQTSWLLYQRFKKKQTAASGIASPLFSVVALAVRSRVDGHIVALLRRSCWTASCWWAAAIEPVLYVAQCLLVLYGFAPKNYISIPVLSLRCHTYLHRVLHSVSLKGVLCCWQPENKLVTVWSLCAQHSSRSSGGSHRLFQIANTVSHPLLAPPPIV